MLDGKSLANFGLENVGGYIDVVEMVRRVELLS